MSNELVTLPPSVTSRGLDVAAWNTLCNSLFPGAKSDSVLMYVDYCKARQLDIMKKPAHIVPISVKDGDGWKYRDVIMPGIYEYRITAHKTKQYLGHDKPTYGDEIDFAGVTAPEWCEMTIKRWHEGVGMVIEYPQRVWFKEVCATKRKDGELVANERWSKAPIQMLTKCCEAAGLREAFPDELGGTYTEDEMYGKVIDVTPTEGAAEGADRRGSNPGQSSGAASGRARGKVSTKEPQATHASRDTPADNYVDSAKEGSSGGADTIIQSQQTLIEQRLKRANIPTSEFCARFEIGEIRELLFDDMQKASEWIADRAEQQP